MKLFGFGCEYMLVDKSRNQFKIVVLGLAKPLNAACCGLCEQDMEDGEKEKVLSKKVGKALAKAEREQEQALAAAFYREFWPENV